jgi:ABC-type lipoprotein export system ATPase subunit
MLQLNKVKPLPLIENGISGSSEVFATEGGVFQKGKSYLVTAASGKGKSTFLHLLYGLRADYEGDIVINNKNSRTLTADEWAQLRQNKLAIVFQDLRLFLNLTAWENIVVKRDLTDTPSVATVRDWINRLGMTAFLDKKTETLSYGQRQRIAIVRALCQPFDFLMLDEPFSHLDSANIKIATDIIQEAVSDNQAGLIHVSLGDPYLFKYDEKLIL